MTPSPKKKLCWNCEGRVSLAEENCPYCAVYLGPAPDENGETKDILVPPYRLVEAEEEIIPPSPYTQEKKRDEVENQEDYSVAKKDFREVVLPLGLLSAGSLFFVFGLILLMFSDKGIFTLTWNGAYWYFYLLFSLPMVFFGWWSLRKIEENIGDNAEPQLLPVEKEYSGFNNSSD